MKRRNRKIPVITIITAVVEVVRSGLAAIRKAQEADSDGGQGITDEECEALAVAIGMDVMKTVATLLKGART